AIRELCHMEVGLAIAGLKQGELGEAALTDGDRGHLARAAGIAPASDPRFQDLDAPMEHSAPPAGTAEVAWRDAALARGGIAPALVDLTRPDIGIPVAKAVAPELQPMPGDVETERLRSTMAITGRGGLTETISLV